MPAILSDELLRGYVKSMTDWELIRQFSYCEKSLHRSDGYQNEIFLIAAENFHGNTEDSIRFLNSLKKIYTHEYSNRRLN